ncbi:hypothetical protein ACFOWZ_24140 [Lentzea rhizosphaerae]|uniref:Acyl-CoA dehydrogenase, N-terminal domain n=1 Tax=Lentzea rhizosphaerae TaxID=2041025 RepID=A0ABV8BXZ0_9PSEU
MAAMRDAGMFRMFVPPSLGGLDLDLLTSWTHWPRAIRRRAGSW